MATLTVAAKPKDYLKDCRKLVFGYGNAKLPAFVLTLSLPAGYACPGARACLSKAHRETGLITDGPDTLFRCYEATSECRSKGLRERAWHNFQALKACKNKWEMADLIDWSLPSWWAIVRVHVGGDFFRLSYLDAWLEIARRYPHRTIYFYTKSIHFWVKRLELIGNGFTPGLLPNVVPTASFGGRYDHLIAKHKLRYNLVVSSAALAQKTLDEGLQIDHDDTHAQTHGPSFASLLHGVQPAGSEAGRILVQLWRQGEYGYGEKADKLRPTCRNERETLLNLTLI